MKKVIFLASVPLHKYWEERYFMRDLIGAGFNVEYWDMADIFSKDTDFTGILERDYARKLDDLQAVEGRLKTIDLKNTVFIFLIPLKVVSLRLYRLLSRYGCKMFTFAYGLMPHGIKDESLARKVLKYAGNLVNTGKMALYFSNKTPLLYKRLKLIKDYDVVFAAGSIATSMHEKHSKIIPINCFDYDNYLRIKDDGNKLVDGDYCVYLDGNLAYDSDCKALNIKTVTPDKYYKALNRFFDLVEKKCGVEVVIAASPESEYADGFFGKRRTYKYKTNELVKDCSFAIADFSSSIAFAVLYKKAIVFYYTDEIKDLSYFDAIKNYAAILDCNIYNIDSLGDGSRLEIKPVDLKKYDDYKYAYLTSKGTENAHSKDIVLSYLNNYSEKNAENLYK